MKKEKQSCPCGSGHPYTECCKRLHKGAPAQNALELVRARFSAFALNLPNYIIATTHPASPKFHVQQESWRQRIQNFSCATHFEALEILEQHEGTTFATVTFVAHIRQEGKDASFTEKSYFEKVGKCWLYKHGQTIPGIHNKFFSEETSPILPLTYYGNACLRTPAQPVENITDDIKELIEQMRATMDAMNGIGLAAPQVHRSLQIFITRAPVETPSGELETGECHVFINPILSDFSTETWTLSEGCLSIPTIYGDVERPKELSIEYTTLEGSRRTRRVTGWEARIIQHEYDHLQGIVFIDHVTKEDKKLLDPLLQQLIKRIN